MFSLTYFDALIRFQKSFHRIVRVRLHSYIYLKCDGNDDDATADEGTFLIQIARKQKFNYARN